MLRVLLITILSNVFCATNIYAQKNTDIVVSLEDSTTIIIDTTKSTTEHGVITTSSHATKVYKPVTTSTSPSKKPELFNCGFIDFQNSGQMNASARVFKLYIGEPKKFMIPISVYSGVSGNNLNAGTAASKGSEQMVLGLINPMSGMFNISIDNTIGITKKEKSITGVSLVYQAGEKLISGQQAITLRPFSFFSTYANSGLLLQTGAWEKDKEKNMGVFWLLFRFHVVHTSNTFQKLSGYPPDHNLFKGYSIGMGIEINNVLNIKSYYYRYLNAGAEIFNIPIYQLTFNYSMKN